MHKFLQTILVFLLSGAMIVFIFSALRPAQYVVENEFLVMSNNVEYTCDKNLGVILARVIKSEAFQEKLARSENNKQKIFNLLKNVKIKNYNNSNIVNVRLQGKSLVVIQRLAENIQRVLLSEADKYYPSQAKIEIKTLASVKVIRTPKIILRNTFIGLVLGGFLGLIVGLFTDLRIDIFENKKRNERKENFTVSVKKKINKRSIRDSKKYKDIIKKRLEKELAKAPIENLILSDEEYVFENSSKNIQRTLSRKKTIVDKDSNVNIPRARVISASTMIVGKPNKEIKEDRVPENLPVFIEEKLPREDSSQKEIIVDNKSIDIEKVSKTVKIVKAQKDDNLDRNKALSKKVTKKEGEARDNYDEKLLQNTERSMPKKASAHDIANGFAPDPKKEAGPTNEEIKDRLNRLLRGEL